MATEERSNPCSIPRLLVAGFVCLLFVACGDTHADDEGSRLPIVSAESFSPNTVLLLTDSCGQEPSASIVEESNDLVEVEVVAGREAIQDGGLDCGDSVEVELLAPLGERMLVDTTTNTAVPVTVIQG